MPEATAADLPRAPRVTHPETKPGTRVTVVETRADWRAFQRVPEHVYWGDPFHIPALKRDVRAGFDRTRNPFFARGDARAWVAWHGHGQPVGRIAAFVDGAHDEAAKRRCGFFGFLEFMNDARVPEALLAEAVAWLRAKGAEEIAGPHSFTPRAQQRGVLVDGFFDDPPYLTSYSPPSYPGFLAALGLEKQHDERGFTLDTTAPPPERLAARAKEVAARDGLAVRRVDLARIEEEWAAIARVAEAANAGLPRYAPASRDVANPSDFRAPSRAVALRAIAGGAGSRNLYADFPAGALVLEEKGAVVGYAVAMLDYNRVLKHLGGSLFPLGWLKARLLRGTIDRVRVLGIAVERPGRGRALPLVHALWSAVHAAGYRQAELATIPEDHERALRLAEGLGAKRTRAWRIYRVPPAFPGARTPSRRE